MIGSDQRSRPLALAAFCLLLSIAPAVRGADLRSDGADRQALSLTVYEGDLGLVQETRSLDLPAGTVQVELADVAARIDASTVQLRPVEGAPLATLEQRFEHDLLSPARLLQRYLGRQVQLLTRDDRGEQSTDAVLLSLEGGRVFRVGDRIWLDHPGEVVLPELPGGLREKPALIWTVEANGGGRRRIELAYLTAGLGWSADHVLRLSPSGDSFDLTTWAALRNEAGAAFEDAELRLVAGQVRRRAGGPKVHAQAMRVGAAMEMAVAEPEFREESAFEYHVYDLDRRVALGEAETRRLRLLGATGVPALRRIVFRGTLYNLRSGMREPMKNVKGDIELSFSNRAADGLGRPLPAGMARAYQEGADGRLLFLGEAPLAATPRDGEVKLVLGRAFDVEMDRTQTDFQAVASGRYDREAAFRIEIRNRKDEPARVVVREPVPGDWKLLESSPAGHKADAATLEFTLTVPAGGTEIITYRVAIDAG